MLPLCTRCRTYHYSQFTPCANYSFPSYPSQSSASLYQNIPQSITHAPIAIKSASKYSKQAEVKLHRDTSSLNTITPCANYSFPSYISQSSVPLYQNIPPSITHEQIAIKSSPKHAKAELHRDTSSLDTIIPTGDVNPILISGFIRRTSSNIPDDIINLIFQFWLIYGEFDPKWKHPHMILNHNNKIVKMPNDRDNNGSIFLSSMLSDGNHKFRFRIIEKPWQIIIGLWRCSADSNPPVDRLFANGKKAGLQGYGYCVTDGDKSNSDGVYEDLYGQDYEARKGNIIEMRIDFQALTLSFCFNGYDLGVSHYLKRGIYKVGVYIWSYNRDGIIQIMQ